MTSFIVSSALMIDADVESEPCKGFNKENPGCRG